MNAFVTKKIIVSARSRRLSMRGFTLVEMMVALAMASVVLAIVFGIYTGLMGSYTTQNVAADVQQTVRAGIDYMAEDIMMAGFNPLGRSFIAIEEAGSTSIRIKIDRNMNGEINNTDFEDITYEYDAGNTRVDQTVLGEGLQTFIGNVTDLSFTYRNADGQDLINDLGLSDPLTNSVDTNNIRTVEISISVQEPAGRRRTVNRTYTTQVWCRNMGL